MAEHHEVEKQLSYSILQNKMSPLAFVTRSGKTLAYQVELDIFFCPLFFLLIHKKMTKTQLITPI